MHFTVGDPIILINLCTLLSLITVFACCHDPINLYIYHVTVCIYFPKSLLYMIALTTMSVLNGVDLPDPHHISPSGFTDSHRKKEP